MFKNTIIITGIEAGSAGFVSSADQSNTLARLTLVYTAGLVEVANHLTKSQVIWEATGSTVDCGAGSWRLGPLMERPPPYGSTQPQMVDNFIVVVGLYIGIRRFPDVSKAGWANPK